MKKTLSMRVRILSFALLCAVALPVFLSGCSSDGVSDDERSALIAQLKSADYIPDLNGVRVGVMEGSTSEQDMDANYPDTELLVFKNNSDAVAALRAGKIDYTYLTDPEAMNYERYSDDLYYSAYSFFSEGHAVSVNKEKTELRDKISAVINKYIADGTMDKIINRWLIDKDESYVVPELPVLENAPELKVAITSTREPLSFIMDGEPQGLIIELIKRVAYELGMTPVFSDMDFAGSLAAVTSGKCDVALGTSVTEERKKSVDFTTPYLEIHHVMLAKIDAGAGDISDFWNDLGEKFYGTFVAEDRWELILSGFGVTLLISFCSLVFGSLFGAVLCAMKMSKKKPLGCIARIYGRIIQGLPLLVILMMLYYILFAKVDISAIVVAVIAFSLTFASSASEIFRTGISTVDKGQTEAALASGFTEIQAFRLITLPQASKAVLSVYAGEFITTLKLTSIVGYISIQDLTKASDIIRSRTYEAFFPLIVIALVYFITIFVFAELMKAIERKLDPSQRKRRVKGGSEND